MSIRKTGTATGQVTGVEGQPGGEALAPVTAGIPGNVPEWDSADRWPAEDEAALAAENEAADRE